MSESLVAVPRRTWIALGAAAASIFLFVFDSGLLSVALPDIEREFSASRRSTLAWAATGYNVALASLLLVGGRIADQRGRKRIYLAGLGAFSLGAFLTAVAPTAPLLIAARTAQGAGGAFMTASSLALVLPLFPAERRHYAVGIWGAVGSLAAVVAPTLGALAVDRVSWRLGFAVVVAFGVLALVIGAAVLDEPVPTSGRLDINPISVLTGSTGLGLLTLMLSQGRRWGWLSWRSAVVGAVAIGLLVVFIGRSKRDTSPLFDLRLMAFRQWSTNTLAAGLQQIGFFSWYLTTPLILVNLWGWSVLEAGSAMAIGNVASAVTGFIGGRWADRRGTAFPVAITSVTFALGPLWLVATASTTPSFWRVFLPAVLLVGASGGICGVLTTGGALEVIPPERYGAANSAHSLFRRLCGTIGVAVALALLGDVKGPAILDGAKHVWIMVAVAHLAMCIPLWQDARAGLRRRRPTPTNL